MDIKPCKGSNLHVARVIPRDIKPCKGSNLKWILSHVKGVIWILSHVKGVISSGY